MAVEVILPKVDMDMATGIISTWHVADGARVKKGQALFDIETDKSAMEIECPADGTLHITHGETGKAIAIGSVVALIYAEGEAVVAKAATPAATPASTPAMPVDVAKAKSEVALPPVAAISSDGTRATPLARRLAREAGLLLQQISGTGPRGRITADDVQRAKAAGKATPMVFAPQGDAAKTKELYAAGSFDVKPLDGMRRIIAQRLTESKQTVPHFYLSATCTIDALMAVRQRLNDAAGLNTDKAPRYKLSINDFVIKALAVALQQVPDANVTFTPEGLLQHHHSDVGVAVSVEGGLFTPVIRRAEEKTLAVLSHEMKALAALARARKLQPADYQGGTAAISNLGMFGVEQFTAIINPPHACILAVGAAVERFVPVNKQPVLATQMTVTLSCDHRAVDGAVGAALLSAFKRLIEDPALMLV